MIVLRFVFHIRFICNDLKNFYVLSGETNRHKNGKHQKCSHVSSIISKKNNSYYFFLGSGASLVHAGRAFYLALSLSAMKHIARFCRNRTFLFYEALVHVVRIAALLESFCTLRNFRRFHTNRILTLIRNYGNESYMYIASKHEGNTSSYIAILKVFQSSE